ncbi:MAG: ATP-binding protein, partial [Tannerellaceae bacterium]
MKSIVKHITTNTRLLDSILTNYKNTFYALCELINNSLQAEARKVEISIDYNSASDVNTSPIRSIVIKDDGHGVPYSEFDKRILDIGANVKDGGLGIGRFAAIQIGALLHIETVAFDPIENKYSITKFPLNADDLTGKQFNEIDFNVEYDYLEGDHNSYYKVTIENMHHSSQSTVPKKKRIDSKLQESVIKEAIFERYIDYIFNNSIQFIINGSVINKSDFIIGQPSLKTIDFTSQKGETKPIKFRFYNIKVPLNKVKVFFTINNAGLQTVAHEYTYSSDWYTPDLGTWYIYLDSPLFDSDTFRNLDLEALAEEDVKALKDKTKTVINDFFKAQNKRFDKFIKTLESDSAYPYKQQQPKSGTQEVLFKKIVYLVEDEYKLLKHDDKIRQLVYPLIDRAIENGAIESLFTKLMKLSDEGFRKFHTLLEKTDL